ncbi:MULTISPECIES: AraC family transcriptional regulator [Acinetobacter]|uniref:AraC family transcriptional regulator n=1 Tax=Acinetobacter TaxID=469 RepID=UPI00157B48CA|nr:MULTISPECIES: AraC family transcriptional regulator [Acinetobacter]MDM1248859.1 AraC family transcriptional regulator [Acinetobacter sp. R933-2]MDM1758238.1 AraC family transcriptional regulator [Acinetobacter sp. 256-1]MDM1760597.1 AraC family transcriptional regulator [Acinetobacter sp. 251-1]MDM1764543.1 AraC family transcriptional regulator [Acinetobacter sp. 226-1]MDM1767518.1 AraC family transcriptional regulator [Acinetobacter sp. 226-4]
MSTPTQTEHSAFVSPFSNTLFSQQSLIFKNSDLAETQHNVAHVLKPHRLKACSSSSTLSSMHHIRCGHLSVSRLEYGLDVYIEPDCLTDFYLIQIPCEGYAEIEFQQQKFISYSQIAALLSPDMPLRMKWKARAPQMILKISKDRLLLHCQQHLANFNLTHPIFDPKLDFSQVSGQYFLQLFQQLLQAIHTDHHPLKHPLALQQFEANIYNALLYGQTHSYQAQLSQTQQRQISPHFIKSTQDYIHAHLHENLTIEILAQHAGISVRSLFLGFQKYLNMTPMQYLKELRFKQVHEELIQGNQAITEVALKWGFTHLGRFSQEYKKRYGYSPSETKVKFLR